MKEARQRPRCEAPVAASGAMRAQSLRTMPSFGAKAQSSGEGERGARRKEPCKNAPRHEAPLARSPRPVVGSLHRWSGTVSAYRADFRANGSGMMLVILMVVLSTFACTLALENKLRRSDAAAGDWFGRSVSISGDVAIVGAYQDDDGGGNSGSAYAYERQADGSWVETFKFVPSDAAAGD